MIADLTLQSIGIASRDASGRSTLAPGVKDAISIVVFSFAILSSYGLIFIASAEVSLGQPLRGNLAWLYRDLLRAPWAGVLALLEEFDRLEISTMVWLLLAVLVAYLVIAAVGAFTSVQRALSDLLRGRLNSPAVRMVFNDTDRLSEEVAVWEKKEDYRQEKRKYQEYCDIAGLVLSILRLALFGVLVLWSMPYLILHLTEYFPYFEELREGAQLWILQGADPDARAEMLALLSSVDPTADIFWLHSLFLLSCGWIFFRHSEAGAAWRAAVLALVCCNWLLFAIPAGAANGPHIVKFQLIRFLGPDEAEPRERVLLARTDSVALVYNHQTGFVEEIGSFEKRSFEYLGKINFSALAIATEMPANPATPDGPTPLLRSSVGR